MENKNVKVTLRCKNCGADHTGGPCIHCGNDQFVDVRRFYDKETVSHYQEQRQHVEL